MKDREMVKCPVCQGYPRRWLSLGECLRDNCHYGSYEDCNYCEDGLVEWKDD